METNTEKLNGLLEDDKTETPDVLIYSIQDDSDEEKAAAADIEKEEKKPEEKTQAAAEPEKKVLPDGEIDLFAELSKPTDKDIEKLNGTGQPASTTTTTSTSLTPAAELANHQLTAKLTIAAVSVGMGIILQVISEDWSEEAENRYKMSDGRKKELLEPLEIMLMNSKKKYNPVVILVTTVLITYIPMFVGAFRTKNKNLLEKRKKAYGITTEATETKEESKTPAADAVPITTDKEKEFNIIAEKIKRIKSKIGRRTKEETEFMTSLGL